MNIELGPAPTISLSGLSDEEAMVAVRELGLSNLKTPRPDLVGFQLRGSDLPETWAQTDGSWMSTWTTRWSRDDSGPWTATRCNTQTRVRMDVELRLPMGGLVHELHSVSITVEANL